MDLPHLKATIRVGGDSIHTTNAPDHPRECNRKNGGWCSCQCVYDAQFYPYTPPGVDPVFAVVRGRNTIVYRPVAERDKGVELLQSFEDTDSNNDLNSVIWSQDVETGDPLLCVTGSGAQIKILNVKTGQVIRRLVGHGGVINDLAISPLSPTILASGSMDHSVRIWSLEQKFKKQPCAVICSGETHSPGILTIAFHSQGRYLLSAGLDTVVNMWAIPDLPDANTGTDKPTVLRYPHFSTTEIHSNYVDCVTFYGDLIISKAVMEDEIVLWKIDGFNSAMPLPLVDSRLAGPRRQGTRSAFGERFQKLLTFNAPDVDSFYVRFGLFHQPGRRPLLAVGNVKSKIFFWDLQRLEEGQSQDEPAIKNPPRKRARTNVGYYRTEDMASNAFSGVGSSTTNSSASDGKKYDISDPFNPIRAHKVITVPKMSFVSRKAAWSTGGDWCVVVGDYGMVCVFSQKSKLRLR